VLVVITIESKSISPCTSYFTDVLFINFLTKGDYGPEKRRLKVRVMLLAGNDSTASAVRLCVSVLMFVLPEMVLITERLRLVHMSIARDRVLRMNRAAARVQLFWTGPLRRMAAGGGRTTSVLVIADAFQLRRGAGVVGRK